MVSELKGPETVGSSARLTATIGIKTTGRVCDPERRFTISPELQEAEEEGFSETPEN